MSILVEKIADTRWKKEFRNNYKVPLEHTLRGGGGFSLAQNLREMKERSNSYAKSRVKPPVDALNNFRSKKFENDILLSTKPTYRTERDVRNNKMYEKIIRNQNRLYENALKLSENEEKNNKKQNYNINKKVKIGAGSAALAGATIGGVALVKLLKKKKREKERKVAFAMEYILEKF